MSNILSSDFPIAKDAYLAFDGLTIKEKIRQRLNQTGTYTDQNFEGSNLAAWNDSFAMVMSLFLYNLNKTANEGKFSEAQIYENVNRIVKDMDYKPIGPQTANLSFQLQVDTLVAGVYTIPRYSVISVGGIKYSFTDDLVFNKTTNGTLETVDHNHILHQGTIHEFPTYTSSGAENELIYLTTLDTDIIDHFFIDVYVKNSTNVWEKYEKTQSLYLHDANKKVYEIRYNENRRYEIKFGNGINGKRLENNDQVSIFYLKSDGKAGEVGANVLNTAKLNLFSSLNYNTVIRDSSALNSNILTRNQLLYIYFDNVCGSSYYTSPESIAQIKSNAPNIYQSQYRLVTKNDFEFFVKSNFSNIVQDVVAMSNNDYQNTYIKYFYNLGLTQPQLESRAMFNQVNFADSCNFNNVYMFVVPKTGAAILSYLNPAHKSLIIETLQEEKILTSDVVLLDPVYMALDVALGVGNTTFISDIPQTQILITKNNNSRRTADSIRQESADMIENYFARKNMMLGGVLDITQLIANLMGIEGVRGIFTRRQDSGLTVEGLRFIIFNPILGDNSASTIISNKQIENSQFAYLYTQKLLNRIVVE
jgi:hypothetical protein